MARIPRLHFVWNRRHDATRNHPSAVELRIGYDGRGKYISTSIHLLKKEWADGTVVNRPDAMELNKALEKMKVDVLKIVNEMYDEGYINIDEIPNRLKRLHKDGRSFIEFCEERADVRKYGHTEDSQERYDRIIRFLKKWGKIKYFSDITDHNILVLDDYLTNERHLKDNSKWNGYHRFINSFIIDAINAGYLKRNPYKWVNINKGKDTNGLSKYLTDEELNRFASTDMHSDCLNRVRDLFIFQTYTCLSYVDMAAFKFSKTKDEGNGHKMYTGKRGKTGKEFTFLILKPAMEVLEKYNYKLPIISNVKYNQYLKVCAQMAGIDKPVSSHWARHTGATILLNEGVSMEVVAKVLGHASTKMTREVYAKLRDKTILNELDKVDKKLSDKEDDKSNDKSN